MSIVSHFFEEKIIDLRALALEKTSKPAKEMKKTNIENLSERTIWFPYLDVLTISILH